MILVKKMQGDEGGGVYVSIGLAAVVLIVGFVEILARSEQFTPLSNPNLCQYFASSDTPWGNRRRPLATPARWCDLGDVLSTPKMAALARYCFQRAVKLGPDVPRC